MTKSSICQSGCAGLGLALLAITLAVWIIAWEANNGLCFGRCADVVLELLRYSITTSL
jgi:hypothetical protein